MNKNSAEEQFYSLKLLFDPNKEPSENFEELDYPSMCKYIRETFNLSKATMAKRLGVSVTCYHYWENGKREPSSKAAGNILALYLQCLYVRKQINIATEAKILIDLLLKEKSQTVGTVCAA